MPLTDEQCAAFREVRPDEAADRYAARYAALDFKRFCELEGLGIPDAPDVRAEIVLAFSAAEWPGL